VYRQGRQGQGFSYFGDESWTDYTLNLKARNVGGSEGFLIVFGRKGGDRVWWNVGGWGNSQHALEHNQTMVGKGVPGKIERDRWYDVKVEIAGARIRCYLDGELVHDAVLPREQTLFSVAGRDTQNGDLILKAITLKNEPVSAEWNLSGFKTLGNAGELTVLTSASLSDNNNLDQPTKVQPTTKSITIAGDTFAAELSPRSLTVLRIKAK
jgi:alpha-L-arabinofuranosidase